MSIWQGIAHWFLRLFGAIENHTKPKELEAPVEDIIAEFPKANLASIIHYYGRPPKAGKGFGFKDVPKAKMVIEKNLPGHWNGGTGRLYMHSLVAGPFRRVLQEADEAGLLLGVRKIGCYNHRHKQHNPRLGLSYHAWGIAFDIDPSKNRSRRKDIPMPFSKQWLAAYPMGIDRELVMLFKRAGFTWGGDWGWDAWEELPSGYDQNNYPEMLKLWEKACKYSDPMHLEGTNR